MHTISADTVSFRLTDQYDTPQKVRSPQSVEGPLASTHHLAFPDLPDLPHYLL